MFQDLCVSGPVPDSCAPFPFLMSLKGLSEGLAYCLRSSGIYTVYEWVPCLDSSCINSLLLNMKHPPPLLYQAILEYFTTIISSLPLPELPFFQPFPPTSLL